MLTKHDEEHGNIAIISSFCKNCGEDFADLVPSKYEHLSARHKIEIPRNTMFSAERQKAVRTLLKEYFRTLSAHVISEKKEIQKQERSNTKSYQTKGELHSDKKDKYELTLQSFKKLIENAEIFADLLNEKMPVLPVDEVKKDEDVINIDIYTPGGKCDEVGFCLINLVKVILCENYKSSKFFSDKMIIFKGTWLEFRVKIGNFA